MLQVAMSGGEVRVVEVPEPVVRPGTVLVRTSHSLISAGTESASIGSGGRRENLVLKAIRNPALVMKVVDRVASHGLKSTAELVKTRVSTEMPSGYSCAGVVVDVGEGVVDIHVGDRVACAGAGYANHASVNVVPRNLVARIPDAVSFEEAAFATLGAIALQGVRRAEPGMGDRVAVLGLGLLGQITAQMLHAAGAVVIGVDVRPDRVARAQALGLDQGFTVAERDFVAGVLERTEGRGADAVIVTAAGGDAGLLNKAFEACRRKGRVVLVGDVPIRIQRDKIYKKEIDFLISTSYGPGRYDAAYEEKGHDYPFGYVRWTEGRNLEEVLRQVAAGSLRVKPLVDATHPVENAGEAYASLASENRPIGILLDYHLDAAVAAPRAVSYRPIRRAASPPKDGTFGVGVVGYGGYFRSMLLPLLKAHPGFSLASACARSGLTVRAAVENDGFAQGTTDYREVLDDPSVAVVYVATRHDLHYAVARAAVEAGKAVFVEKPMTMTVADARELAEAVERRGTLLTVGFNRRFSPHAARLKELARPDRLAPDARLPGQRRRAPARALAPRPRGGRRPTPRRGRALLRHAPLPRRRRSRARALGLAGGQGAGRGHRRPRVRERLDRHRDLRGRRGLEPRQGADRGLRRRGQLRPRRLPQPRGSRAQEGRPQDAGRREGTERAARELPPRAARRGEPRA